MPNKTIYVKSEDLPLWDSLAANEDGSISSLFAEFLVSKTNKQGKVTLGEMNRMDPAFIPLTALNLAMVNAVDRLSGVLSSHMSVLKPNHVDFGEREFIPVNPAKEDQDTIYFVCSACGCLVRSDYVNAHRNKCNPA